MHRDLTDAQAGMLGEMARKTDRLRLLVLHGSRARGDARPDSDWYLGYLAEPGFDPDGLLVFARHRARCRPD